MEACTHLGKRIGLLLLLSALAASYNFAQTFDSRGIATLQFPVTGARLKQGVLLSSGLASGDVCVTGETFPSAPIPQIQTVRITSHQDASSYLRELKVSANAQANFLFGSADLKTTYVTSHRFISTETTLAVYATVEQRLYVVPGDSRPSAAASAADVSVSQGIQLTQRAVALLRRNPNQFRRRCGDGFIAVVIQGAELFGTIAAKDTSQDDSSNLAASSRIDAFGQNVSGSLADVLRTAGSNHTLTIDFTLGGGAGTPSPTDSNGLLAAVHSLSDAASRAPLNFAIIVRDYKTLPNWPTGVHVVPPRPDPLDQIMTMYWRVDTL